MSFSGCKGRANAGHRQKTRRPEGFLGRPVWLRCSSLTDHCGYARSSRLARPACRENRPPLNFQTGSEVRKQRDLILVLFSVVF